MSGQKLSARSYVCGPPFSAFEGTDGDGDVNLFKCCTGDGAGIATYITNYNDGGTTTDGMHNPTVSPDTGSVIYEQSDVGTGFTEIWVVPNLTFETPTQVLADGSNYLFHPWWGPDSDTIVYVRGAAGALIGGSIETVAISGGSPTVLKSAAGGLSPYRPQFSPDGTMIAYMFDQDVGTGASQLRVMNADGSGDILLDTIDRYRLQGGQFSWSPNSQMIAYDDGANGTNAAYVINADATGKTQINANGDAAGANVRVSDRAWPRNGSYVVFSSDLALGAGHNPIRAELDGSDTTDLNAAHGAWAQDYFRQVIVHENRIWFIENNTTVASCSMTGSAYRVDLTIDGAQMGDFSTGDGWYFN